MPGDGLLTGRSPSQHKTECGRKQGAYMCFLFSPLLPSLGFPSSPLLCPGQTESWSSFLCLLCSWDYRHTLLCLANRELNFSVWTLGEYTQTIAVVTLFLPSPLFKFYLDPRCDFASALGDILKHPTLARVCADTAELMSPLWQQPVFLPLLTMATTKFISKSQGNAEIEKPSLSILSNANFTTYSNLLSFNSEQNALHRHPHSPWGACSSAPRLV